MKKFRVLRVGLLAIWFTLTVMHAASAQERQPSSNEYDDNDLGIVLRISDDYFDALTNDRFEMSFSVDRTVDGMPVKGGVHATGRASVKIVESATRAEFLIMSQGVATSDFSVDAGPATLHASSVIDFTTTKAIAFDGIDFRQLPASAITKTCTRYRGVCPRRRGLIGHVVKKVGRRIADRNWSEVNKQVDEAANEYIVNKFERSAEELITKLDELSQFDETVEIILKHFPELETAQYHLRGTEKYVLVGVGQPDATFPTLPSQQASVELWLKTRPIEAAFLEVMTDWNLAHDLLREYVSEEEAKEIADDLNVETQRGWTVLRIGMKEMESDATGQPTESGRAD